jgi:hypothetical protein
MNRTEPYERNSETVDLAYSESRSTLTTLAAWYDGLDTKVVTLFSLSTALAGLVPTFGNLKFQGASAVFVILALLAWTAAAVECFVAFQLREFRIDPSPRTLLDSRWLGLDPAQYKSYRLEDMAKSYDVNKTGYSEKATALAIATVATFFEVLCLTMAILTSG